MTPGVSRRTGPSPLARRRGRIHVRTMTDVVRGDTVPVYADELPPDAFILDVREPGELAEGAIPGSTMIPLGQLRRRLAELPKDRKIVAQCRVGLRGYLAERILRQNGFDAATLSGGLLTWKLFQKG